MGSRLRENVKYLYECFCEVAEPVGENEAWILQRYPESYTDQEILKSVPKFAYPCELKNTLVQHFSFVLTHIDSKWTFGFCRHDPKTQTALVILSALPWHEAFYKLLNQIASLMASGGGDLWKFLEDVHNCSIPLPGCSVTVPLPHPNVTFVCRSPKLFQLPSIPENRNLTEYYSAVDSHNMMMIFASMLYERRIIFTSKRLSRLSACVQACNALIYPMIWQHIYIPVLPLSLMDYLLAPMPFLIGVPSPILQRARKSDLGDVVILDADMNMIESPFQDLESLPPDVVNNLRRALRNRAALLGDGVSRAFLRALVQLTAGYREALTLHQGERITFDQDAFVESRPSSMQPFLRKMLELQIFQQFIEERLHMLNSGLGFSDEFELEACNYSDKSNSKFRQQYREWTYAMRKEGTAFFRSVKDKVKDKSKDMRTVYKGLKWKGRSSRHEESSRFQQPRSAPSSPTLERSPAIFSSPSKPLSGFTATTSYRKEPRFRNSAVPETSRKQYSPLSSSSPEECDPLPERLNIDLMHEMRDVIFPNTPPVDRTLKPVRSLDSLRSAWSGHVRHGPLLPVTTSHDDEVSQRQSQSQSQSAAIMCTLGGSAARSQKTEQKSTLLASTRSILSSLSSITSGTSGPPNELGGTNRSSGKNSSSSKDSSSRDSSPGPKEPAKRAKKGVFPSLSANGSSRSRAQFFVGSREFINPTNPFLNQQTGLPELVSVSDGTSSEETAEIGAKVAEASNPFAGSQVPWDENFGSESSEALPGDPFDTSRALNPFLTQNSVIPSSECEADPKIPSLNARHSPALAKEFSEERDLIRLDSVNSDDDFDPLLSKSSKFNDSKQMTQSLHIPQMGEGLSNPLYPYFLPSAKNPESQAKNQPEKLGDFDLLQEYGLDFNKFSVTNGGASSSGKSETCEKSATEISNSIDTAFGSLSNEPTVKLQNNWTKFE
ncbi:DENN domain-containing protein 1C isoform X2 [Orussus abietinus]|uniref:DENN domain-containing protein 1C isoform X2 n=1 Tax=Orussus abietinus TaxID=222816 RepID=UPI000C715B48|nr:DENN domain-containing protein 1C isoform X2 [Orussus abietinus]